MARPFIDPVRDRPTLLDHGTRRAIARACRGAPRSVAELEKLLTRKSLHKIVGQLEEWGVIVASGETSRGSSKYSLETSWHPDLVAAVKRSNSALFSDQRLFLLSRSDLAEAARCLAREHSEDLAWVGVIGEGDGLVIGVEESESGPSISELQRTLEEAGVEAELSAMAAPATGPEIAPYLRGIGDQG